MKATVVIRSKDEADRLRLTLASLARQSALAQVVVVNDGSSDHTADVLREAERDLELVAVHNGSPSGRSAAANAGASRASGEIVIFLDGDTLAEPEFVARHMARHRERKNLIVRGETHHLRCTRPFLDPECGTPRSGEEDRVARMSGNELRRALVTRQQIREDFGTIDRRSQPGIYPGFGPRKLYELEMAALHEDEDCSVLWAAASGANQSLSREAFLEAGGFHQRININEHRELALRLCRAGMKMVAAGARSYHMTHRSGWRDPLEDLEWEAVFYDAHPEAAVALLPLFWQSINDNSPLPTAARINSLRELEERSAPFAGMIGRDAVRRAHIAAVCGKVEAVL
jgi:glycosyltransferase involved in cell wall biosynthesis